MTNRVQKIQSCNIEVLTLFVQLASLLLHKKTTDNKYLMICFHLSYMCGEGNGNPFQYCSLENPIEEEPGGLQSMGSQKHWTRLSD